MMAINFVIYSKLKFIKPLVSVLTWVSVMLKCATSLLSVTSSIALA